MSDFAKDTNVPVNDCINRQAAIDAVSSMFAPTPTQKDMAEDCLEIIKNLPSAQPDLSEYSDKLWRNAYERGKRDAQTQRKTGKWIPCSERLPEDEQFVLATYKTTDRIHVCQYHEDGSRNQWYSLNDMCRAHNSVVLAWMPLPEPYREERRTDETD